MLILKGQWDTKKLKPPFYRGSSVSLKTFYSTVHSQSGERWATGLAIDCLLVGQHVSNGANSSFWQLPTQKAKTRWATRTIQAVGLRLDTFSVAHRKRRTPVYVTEASIVTRGL